MSESDLVISRTNSLLLPLLPLRDIVVYPQIVVPLFVGRKRSIAALEAAMTGEKEVFLVAQKKPTNEEPKMEGLFQIGTVAKVLQLLKLPDSTVKVLVEGQSRAILGEIQSAESYLQATANLLQESQSKGAEIEVLLRSLREKFAEYVKKNKKIPQEVSNSLSGMKEPGRIADTIAAHMGLKVKEQQNLLEMVQVEERVSHLLSLILGELDILQLEKKVHGQVKKRIDRNQREFYLNEQIKVIQKELGENNEGDEELKALRKKIDEAGLSKEAKGKADAELKKLKMMSPMSAEAAVGRNYIEALTDAPWKKRSRTRSDLAYAKKVLNEDHYGLKEVKEWILEYLAVQKRVRKMKGSILCLVGPPGVGKTSLGQSVARATNRKFVRMSLGGVRDEAEIRGHRRTYIGSMPGKVIQNMTKVGVKNPLFLLDEIDKMAMDFRGDSASALLEVLDPEQNNTFSDHYLEVDYDLSEVMFIATANSLDIPGPLRDRMEIIRIPGYTEEEKLNIAEQYLIPKQKKENGLKESEVCLSHEVVLDIIRHYTKEAGVRGLERKISRLFRKAVKKIVLNENISATSPENLEEYLGVKEFRVTVAEKENQIGQVVGLAWTEVGGELLNVEAVVIPGEGKFSVTGQLGDVMKESIQAATTVVRSRSRSLGIPADFYGKQDIHIHVPEGAIPKDGPSAGIGMCTALVSALTGIPVRADVAMTGEITLRGEILPIGGLKEKLLAAHQSEIRTVLIPEGNRKDLKEIPESVKESLEIKPVRWVDEVLAVALQDQPLPLSEDAIENNDSGQEVETDQEVGFVGEIPVEREPQKHFPTGHLN